MVWYNSKTMVKNNTIIPEHIAIIMDGNRRWAKEKGLASFNGHKRSAENLEGIFMKAKELDIKCLTLWAFSTENWKRSKEEVDYLFNILSNFFDKHFEKFIQEDIHFVHLGRKDRLDKKTLNLIERLENETNSKSDHTVALAIDYGGHDELIRALSEMKTNNLEITSEHIENHLDTAGLPQIDLIVRTGGEKRLSGFMAWQVAYAELLFMDKYFPDFTPDDLEACVEEFSKRERRFGGDSNK